MENCQNCGSNRLFFLYAHASDLHTWEFHGIEEEGYAPEVQNICSGDDTEVTICLDCGQAQGKWPVPDPKTGDEDDEFSHLLKD